MTDSTGAVNWEVARQVAVAVASGGESEADPEPSSVRAVESLARAAEMALERAGAIRVERELVAVQVRSRSAWAAETVDALGPLIERLSQRLGAHGAGLGPGVMTLGPEGAGVDGAGMEGLNDAMRQAMDAVLKPLAPIFTGMQMGLVLGFLGTRALSQYDLCLPREGPLTAAVILRNVDEAADEAGVPQDEMRMWVALHELAHAGELSQPWVRRRLQSLLEAYLDSIRIDAGELQQHLARLDPQDPEALQRFAETAEGLLGKFISTDQPDVLESVQTFVSVLESYASHMAQRAAGGLLRDPAAVVGALRQRSEEAGDADRLLENLLGLRLTAEHLDGASTFCSAVEAAAGIEGLNRMWESLETFPTKEELERPGEWLNRMNRTPPGGLFAGSEDQ